MRAINKTIFLFLLLAISFLLVKNLNIARAENKQTLEIVYPKLVKDVEPPTSIKTYLPRYIQYVYTFAIVCGGIIALMALILGGFKYLSSAGNPAAMSDAKDQIFSGIIGLVVMLGAYIFLNELNPRITELRIPSVMGARRGIIAYNVADCAGLGVGGGVPELGELPKNVNYQAIESSLPLKEPDNKPSGAPKGWKVGSIYSFHKGSELSVYLYENDECKGDAKDQVKNIEKGECVNVDSTSENIRCVRLIWRLPGVWVFGYEWGNPLEPGRNFNAGGGASSLNHPYAHYQVTQEGLPPKLNNKVHSIGLVRETGGKESIDYGVILHNLTGGFMQNKGWSQVLLPSSDARDVTVYNISSQGDARSVSSITIFNIPREGAGDEQFVLCRNPRCDPEWDEKNKKYVYPQLKIRWGKGDVKLDDITSAGCGGGTASGQAINSNDSKAVIASPSSWGGKPKCEWSNIIGGAKILGGVGMVGAITKEWKNEDGSSLKDLSPRIREISLGKAAGVSAIYMPVDPQYIALLYDRREDPEKLIQSSATDFRSSAAVVHGDLADLTTIRWNDRTAVLVAVRVKF